MELLYKRVFENYITSKPRQGSAADIIDDELFGSTKLEPLVYSYDKQIYEENLKNYDATVINERVTLVVEKDERKVSLKIYFYSNSRRAGKKFYKKIRSLRYLTYNLKTKNFYNGGVGKLQNKRKRVKSVRVNSFVNANLYSFIREGIIHVEDWNRTTFFSTSKVGSDMNLLFDKSSIRKDFATAVKVFETEIGVSYDYDKVDLNIIDNSRILKFFLDSHGFKYPNNFDILVKSSWGYGDSNFMTKRNLRKHKNNLIDAFMRFHKLSGYKFRKYLHTAEKINPSFLTSVTSLVDKNYFEQADDVFYTSLFNYSKGHNEYYSEVNIDVNLSKQERKNLFELVYESITTGRISYRDIVEHVNFYIYIKKHGGDVSLRAKNKMEFRDEHLRFSELYQSYKKGFWTRIYDEEMVKHIQNPIFGDFGVTYYPVVLKNTDDYNEESSVQNNCVRTYILTPNSFIVSLRESEYYGDNRLTVEYKVYNLNNKIDFKRVQTRSRFNEKHSEMLDPVLEILDKRFSDFFNKNQFKQFIIEKKIEDNSFVRRWESKYVLSKDSETLSGYRTTQDVWSISWELNSDNIIHFPF